MSNIQINEKEQFLKWIKICEEMDSPIGSDSEEKAKEEENDSLRPENVLKRIKNLTDSIDLESKKSEDADSYEEILKKIGRMIKPYFPIDKQEKEYPDYENPQNQDIGNNEPHDTEMGRGRGGYESNPAGGGQM